MVLTSKKNDPKVSVPMVAGKMNDPVLADWQAGLGKTIVFTSDPTAKWGTAWVSSSQYDAFWGNAVQSVERPPMSEDFDVHTSVDGSKGKIVVEALNKTDSFVNFLNIGGQVLDPKGNAINVRLVQTGPGTYEANFDAKESGSYAVALSYHGKQSGYLRGGVAVNSEPEYRELTSNDAKLQEIADKTGGRVLAPWDAANADLFSRQNVGVTASPLPVWDILLPILLAMILLDVATRRIAWDWASIRRMALAVGKRVRSFTSVRKVKSRETLDAFGVCGKKRPRSKFRPAETRRRRSLRRPSARRLDPIPRPSSRPKPGASKAISRKWSAEQPTNRSPPHQRRSNPKARAPTSPADIPEASSKPSAAPNSR